MSATESRAVQMEASWKEALASEFDAPYMRELGSFLRAQKSAGRVIYPPGAQMFNAFNLTPLDDVRVVIIGQDPYHGPGQAHGLCFSVAPGVQQPPSLVNIVKEINEDFAASEQRISPDQGCLEGWARQGVLLLNSVLSVERGNAASHRGKGWETFTDRVVQVINERCEAVVFLLWGSYAQAKGKMVDRDRHLVLGAPHPSPLSAHRGFFGCRHFSRANAYLTEHGKTAVDWFAL